jgi:serine O-acetyltransferase
MEWRNLRVDLARAYGRTSGGRLRRMLECLASPGVQAVVIYRLGRWSLGLPAWARLVPALAYGVLNFMVRLAWGIEISRRAAIGPGLYIGHFGTIIVGRDTTIGANCSLSQDVTIGLAGNGPLAGVPTIGDDVYIAPGARLFGRIRVGDNVKIGANAVVHRDVPSNAVVVLDPGFRIVSYRGNRRAA